MGGVEVGQHPVGVHRHPADQPQRERVAVVEQDRRVGQRHPLDRRVRDVALVPQRHVLEAGLGVAPQQASDAGDPLGDDRVALVGHRRRALLARAERLLDLAHLGALQVADLGGEALQARPPPARWPTAARRGGRAPPPGSRRPRAAGPAGPARWPRARGRWRRRCRPRPTAPHRRPLDRLARAARRLRSASKAKPASLTPKVVGSAWTPWVRPTHSVARCSRARAISASRHRARPLEDRARPRRAAAPARCPARRRR